MTLPNECRFCHRYPKLQHVGKFESKHSGSMVLIADLRISAAKRRRLEQAGIITVGDLAKRCLGCVFSIPAIGHMTYWSILAAIEENDRLFENLQTIGRHLHRAMKRRRIEKRK